MTIELSFHERLDANPTDWNCRLDYAQWLTSKGRLDEANTQRWMEKNNKAPAYIPAIGMPPGTSKWWWGGGYAYLHCNLEPLILYAIPSWRKGFLSRVDAELALMESLKLAMLI